MTWGKANEERWEEETSIENRAGMHALIINLKETSKEVI
jgi:hypothetical protein